MEDIEAAATVYFGEYLSLSETKNQDKAGFVTEDTPESILISKTMFQVLSKEAKEVILIILDAPEEMFFVDGRVKHLRFRQVIRDNLQLSWKVIASVEKELKTFLNIY